MQTPRPGGEEIARMDHTNSMRRVCMTWTVCVVLLMVPTAVWAQATITGTARDTSGAVLPGVTVEAASPALIERVRSVITDSTGQYRIVDLRSGTYAVTFTLPGFSTFRREGVELSGAFNATIDAQMQVGALAETVTVSGESPMVDVKSARREQIVNRDLLTAIPSARTYQTMIGLAPGVTTGGSQDVGGLNSPATRTFAIHGGPQTEGRVMVDGMNAGAARGGAGVSNYQVDVANAQELAYTLSGGLGEAETGGPTMNVVPRTGGNIFTGSLFFSGANSAMQGSNLTQELRDAGLRDPNELIKAWEANGAIGGPIIRDRLWFFLSTKRQITRLYVSGMYYNKNDGNPNAWAYEPDLTRRAIYDGTWTNVPLRLTLQATPRNKFNIFWDEQKMCLECEAGGTPTVAPEASGGTWDTDFQRFHQITWTSPITSRLLAEAGYSHVRTKYGRQNRNADLIPVTDQGGIIPGLTYRSGGWLRNLTTTPRWRAAVSYVTGAHNMKVGYEGQFLSTDGGHTLSLPVPGLPLQQRCAQPADHAGESAAEQRPCQGHGTLRSGSVECRPVFDAGGAPLRPRVELQRGRAVRPIPLRSQPHHYSRHQGCRCIERHFAARRDGLRPVRQQEDLAARERGAVPGRASGRRDLQFPKSDRTAGDIDEPQLGRCGP